MKPIHFFAGILTGLLVAGATGLGQSGAVVSAAGDSNSRVYELRTYHTNPGKLDELHKRFRDHTNTLFVKHGMTLIGYWNPTDGEAAENTLVYLLAHDSREAAKKSWASFIADPEWKAAYAASEANGKLVDHLESQYLRATDFSPLR